MIGHVDYLLDPDWTLDIGNVTAPDTAAQFAPLPTHQPDFGYTKSAIWLRFSLSNGSDSIDQWRLLFRENFMQVFEVYLVGSDGTVETLTKMDEETAFAARPLDTPTLAIPFGLPPGASATILVRYWSGGSSQITWSVESLESFNAHTARGMPCAGPT